MTPSPVPDRIPASQAAFPDDVRRTLHAWRSAPLLPVVTVGVGVGVGVVQLLPAVESPAVAGSAGPYLFALALLGYALLTFVTPALVEAAYYVRNVPGAGPDGAVRLAPEPGQYPPSTGW